ncbi:MAG: CheR family methyltransferase [Pseudomonadota bacterium]
MVWIAWTFQSLNPTHDARHQMQQLDPDVPNTGTVAFPVVGVGASAGGLEAFRELISGIEALGRKGDMAKQPAYVLIQHLDPTSESLLPELLSKRSSTPVVQISDGMAVESGKLYLIPPGFELTIKDATLYLNDFDEPRGLRRPIDRFFESLARAQGQNSAAIILSGTGSDGSNGAKSIKEQGGFVFVQDTSEAKYDGMPSSAFSTGAADLVLPAGEMARVIAEYFERGSDLLPELRDDEDLIARIAKHVRYRTGHDFSGYKKATVRRRLARRMLVSGCESPRDYLQVLISDPAEATNLFNELLINVTSFFRDDSAFQAMRAKVITPLLAERDNAGQPIRIWVPGCSTGQEAFTLAMLLREEMSRLDARVVVNIFGTDVDRSALHVARTAQYPDTIAHEVPERLLERYFSVTPDGYRVVASIRDMVRFSHHDVLADPPFSKLDMVSCRNLLIYFDAELQKQVMRTFHYALKPQGTLFLGMSEGLSDMRDAYEVVDASNAIFRRKVGKSQPLKLQSPVQDKLFDRERSDRMRPDPNETISTYQHRVLRKYAPAHVVIDTTGTIVYSSERTGTFLEFPQGQATLRLHDLGRDDLQLALRSMLNNLPAKPGERMSRTFDGMVNDEQLSLYLIAERLSDDTILVVFQDRLDPRRDDDWQQVRADELGQGSVARVHDLEEQLESAQQTVRTTVEELETSNEELKSSNEEMMSMNEELQSANEELSTVNDELKYKVQELDRLNADLSNLIDSTKLAIIFLDEEGIIRSFTPEAQRYFRVIDKDIGRPFEHIRSEFEDGAVGGLLESVAERGAPVEAELEAETRGEIMAVRVSPYMTSDGDRSGSVIVLNEVTELRKRGPAGDGRGGGAGPASRDRGAVSREPAGDGLDGPRIQVRARQLRARQDQRHSCRGPSGPNGHGDRARSWSDGRQAD